MRSKLPLSWPSAAAYKEGMIADELPAFHLRNNVLPNGLRYVTIQKRHMRLLLLFSSNSQEIK